MHWKINKGVYVYDYEFSTETCEFYYFPGRKFFQVPTWNPEICSGFQPGTWKDFRVPTQNLGIFPIYYFLVIQSDNAIFLPELNI